MEKGRNGKRERPDSTTFPCPDLRENFVKQQKKVTSFLLYQGGHTIVTQIDRGHYRTQHFTGVISTHQPQQEVMTQNV